MNSRLRPLYILSFLIMIAYVTVGWFNNPPDGRTGAPGDGLCSDCHLPPSAGQDGNVTITGLPASIMANSTYNITLTSTNPNGLAVRGGFQMTVLDGSDNDVGMLSNPSANTVVTPSGGRNYWEHNPAQNYPASNTLTWTIDWTAPAGPTNETITMYAANNVANGNGDNSGDLIVTTQATGTIMGGGDPLSVEITSSADVTCFGMNDGSATAEASGGTPPYTYNWSNGESGPTATSLSGGMHTVTVTDDENEMATANVNIGEPDDLVAVEEISADVLCNGEATGSATVSAQGGNPPYSYDWPGGLVGPSQDMLAAGIYTVTVTDINDCVDDIDIVIGQPEPLEVSIIDQTDVVCQGESTGTATASAVGGVPPHTYEWSSGGNGATETNLPAGIYTVTATDANNCEATAEVTIVEPEALLAVIVASTNPLCAGDANGMATVAGNGGTPPYFYDWSTGGNGETETDLLAGTYTVTVTDFEGCMDIAEVTLDDPVLLTVQTVNAQDPLCHGEVNGSITVAGNGGTPPYLYDWSTGGDTDTEADLPAGTYTVTVTDANDCEASAEITLSDPDSLSLAVTDLQHPLCAGEATGSATVQASGGVAPYQYLWPSGNMGAMQPGLTAGSYTVTVLDQNECQAEVEFTLLDPPTLVAAIDQQTNVDCNGNATGSALGSASGGTPPYMFLWSNGDMDTLAENLGAGEYELVISDVNGCTDTATATITEPDALAVNAVATDETASDAEDGTATANPSGGTPPYAYLWNTGETTAMIDSLAPGDYNVTVTDANDCQASQTVTVNAFGCTLTVEGEVTNILCPGDTTGMISLDIEGASGDVTIMWSNGSSSDTISDLAAGSYTVTVSDEANCSVIETYAVSQPEPLAVNATATGETAAGAVDGTAAANPAGGTPPYTYAWNNGENTAMIDSLAPGSYTVTVTDANNCMAEQTVNVSPFDCDLSTDGTVAHVSCYGGSDGEVCIAISNGTAPYDIEWSTGQSGDTCLQDLPAGTYGVTVVDADQCSASDTFAVEQPDSLHLQIVTLDNPCFGADEGSVGYLISGGTPPYNVSINPDLPTDSLPAGDYSLMVQDQNNCMLTKSFQISQPDSIAISQDSVNHATGDNADGSIYVSVAGGTPPYTFEWQNEDSEIVGNSEDLEGVTAGFYTLTVLDDQGCTTQFGPVEVEMMTAVSDPSILREIMLYPVPAREKLQYLIELENISAVEIQLISSKGQLVYSERPAPSDHFRGAIETTSLAPDIYFLRIVTDRGPIFRRILIQ